jgi:hypothetical protein
MDVPFTYRRMGSIANPHQNDDPGAIIASRNIRGNASKGCIEVPSIMILPILKVYVSIPVSL